MSRQPEHQQRAVPRAALPPTRDLSAGGSSVVRVAAALQEGAGPEIQEIGVLQRIILYFETSCCCAGNNFLFITVSMHNQVTNQLLLLVVVVVIKDSAHCAVHFQPGDVSNV